MTAADLRALAEMNAGTTHPLHLSTVDILAALDDAERVATERVMPWQPMDTAPQSEWVLVCTLGLVTIGRQTPEGRWYDEAGLALAVPSAWTPLPEPPHG